MTKLKTLEDIPFLRLCSPELISAAKDKNFMLDINKAVKIYDLKKEAIKLIKLFQETMITMDPNDTVKLVGYWWTHGRLSGAISGLMFFNNIADEDLK